MPVKTRADVDAIRKTLDAEPTLREKRGKPLTYDIVAFYDFVPEKLDNVKTTIGRFRSERFPVRIEGESNGVLRVSTISPRGFEQRLKQEYNLEPDGHGRWRLTSKAGETRSPASETGGTRSRASENEEDPPVSNAPPAIAQEPDPPVVTKNVPSLPVVVQELDFSAVTSIPPIVVHEFDNPAVTNVLPQMIVPENGPPVSNDLATVAQERDPPVVTNAPPRPVVSVTDVPASIVSVADVPKPPVVSVADVPKPPVVSVTDETEKVVIVGTNGVIARFGRVGEPKPVKSSDSVPVTNSLPAKVEGKPPIIRTGIMPGGRTDF